MPMLRFIQKPLLVFLLVLLGACSSLPFSENETAVVSIPADSMVIQDESITEKSEVSPEEFADPGFIGLDDAILQLAKLKPSNNLWDHIRADFALPEFNSSRVRFYERQFSRHPEYMARVLARAKWFLPTMYAQTKALGYPSELTLIPAIESAYKTDALSRTGASGLWQFIRSTGKLFGMQQNWWYDGRRDPSVSTPAALKYLAQLNKRFDGNWILAIAGYNAGGRTIEREVERNQRANRPAQFQHLKLRKETRDYIPKLIAWRNIVADPEKFGVTLPSFPMEPQFAQINAGSQINISLLTKLLDVKPTDIRFLNSAYKHGVTPPNGPHWVNIPTRNVENARSQLASLSHKDRMLWTQYRVRKGDVLGKISRKYNVSVTAIRSSNQLKNNLIHPGDILLIPALGSKTGTINKTGTRQQASKKIISKNKQDNGRLKHRIRSGDTLWEIAKRYGVKVADISRWNSIRPSQTLKLGEVLLIYRKS